MNINHKHLATIVIGFITCFIIYTYWSTGAGLVSTIYQASLPFIMGAGLAYIINIVMSLYEKAFDRFIRVSFFQKIKRTLSMLLSYLSFFLVIFWIVSIVLPDLISSINSLIQAMPSAITKIVKDLSDNEQVQQIINYAGGSKELSTTVQGYTSQILSQILTILNNMLSNISSLPSAIINLFISLIFSAYVLASKERLYRQVNTLIDVYLGRAGKKIRYVADILNHRFHSFFVSQTVEACILGSLCYIGMLLFRFPHSATISVLIGFTAIIPIVGAYVGLIIGFILIMTKSLLQAVLFVVYLQILQQIEGNLIYPRVVGTSTGLPGMWVLLAITVGGALGGVLGMLLSVPLAASIYQIIKDNVAMRQIAQAQSSASEDES